MWIEDNPSATVEEIQYKQEVRRHDEISYQDIIRRYHKILKNY